MEYTMNMNSRFNDCTKLSNNTQTSFLFSPLQNYGTSSFIFARNRVISPSIAVFRNKLKIQVMTITRLTRHNDMRTLMDVSRVFSIYLWTNLSVNVLKFSKQRANPRGGVKKSVVTTSRRNM